MPKFVFVFLGGNYPTDPGEAQKHFEDYHRWLVSLGDAVISPAVPFKNTHTVQADGKSSAGSTSAMSGLSIMSMGSMEEALDAARSCPFLKIGGVLEISELIEMSGEAGGGAPN